MHSSLDNDAKQEYYDKRNPGEDITNIATRLKTVNGLELSATDAEALVPGFEASFPLLVVVDPADV